MCCQCTLLTDTCDGVHVLTHVKLQHMYIYIASYATKFSHGYSKVSCAPVVICKCIVV